MSYRVSVIGPDTGENVKSGSRSTMCTDCDADLFSFETQNFDYFCFVCLMSRLIRQLGIGC